MPVPPNSFQMRVENMQYRVYMIRVNGRDVPREKQEVVWGPGSWSKVQPIADALNNGLLDRIIRQFQQQRLADHNAEAVRRLLT